MKKQIITSIFCLLAAPITLAQQDNYYIGASYMSAETNLGPESKYNAGYDVHLG